IKGTEMDEGTSSMPKAEENIDLIIETAEFDGSGMRYDTSMFGPKTHQCEVCGYVASNHGCLVIHRRTHTGEKPFRCDQCDYASTRKGNLVRHKEIHTENKAMCAVCHMMLKSVNLKRHYKIRHPEIPIPDNFGDMIVFDNTSQGMVWSSSNEITDGSDHGSFVIEDVRTVQSTNYAGNESNHVDHFNKGLYNPSIASDSERSLVLNINNGVITREAYEDMPSHHAHMRETSHNYIENAATVRNMANVHSRPLLSERFMGNPECSKSSFAATSNQINCTATAMTRESTPPYSTTFV
uniref:Zinc finger protein 251-like n=1 Tax=Saccoglossus kowalevskii TaxID=10224 RepID=A0ABM0LZM0_SACKO